ncbi:succinate dehydrogenase [ubiquinone] cytochrome b small subunit, mitochondrial-like [Uranotaenia lowii]|uniref:succinate dehydrogenase [ubiquinone] cytochrome b small subunit, mitochondrial-like n=1 Tax=Uranotaenia lowii TaxID=190385 RepID=UPI002479E18C|nr:succinate dehydrogenase [ubiquinone] cytochrome b small subunit, mitochondrial-like [Uranotaenia lowii]
MIGSRLLLSRTIRPVQIFKSYQFPASWTSHRFCAGSSPSKKEPSYRDASYIIHWKIDRLLNSSMVVAIPLGFTYPNPITDTLLALAVMIHTHMGVEMFIDDYFTAPTRSGGNLRKVLKKSLIGLTMVTLVGFFWLIYKDIGLVNTIRGIWAVKPKGRE